jgi:hypothetical protein
MIVTQGADQRAIHKSVLRESKRSHRIPILGVKTSDRAAQLVEILGGDLPTGDGCQSRKALA